MRNTITALLACGGLALAATPAATAAQTPQDLAERDCAEERRTEPGEFKTAYGGTGKAAMARCVRAAKREARADCRRERRTEPGEFAAEYGGKGRAAMKRCVRDELT